MTQSERTLLDLLWARLSYRPAGMPPRYVMAEHVRYDPAYGLRIADAISLDTWGSGHWQIEGYEVKATRGDWLRELRDPGKAECWQRHCSRWFVLAPTGVVRPDELPTGWGLITTTGGRLRRAVKPTTYPDPTPLPPRTIAGLMRAVQQTAQHHARQEQPA